ncbi:MAG: hypothetical protein IIZ39_04750, partial [Blautia sp.]|nr:hypothetical protein [Blautia sp.]
RDTPEEMASYAKSLGFTALGFSGHMDQEIHMDFAAYQKEIKRVEGLYEGEMEVLCGVELDTLYDASLVTGAEYIIGSTHYLDIPDPSISAVDVSGEMLQKACEEFFGGDYYALCRSYYELEAKVYEKTHCTFVGHFDLVTRFNDELHFVEEEDPRYYKPAMEVMEYLVSLGLPFEINAGAVNRGRKKEFYPGNRLLRHLKELGGEMIISSDAHQKELLNGGFEQAVEMAIACGFTHVLMPTKEGGRLTMRHVALA